MDNADLPLVFIQYIKSFLLLFSKYSILSFAESPVLINARGRCVSGHVVRASF